MSWLREFREFAVKGNAIDLAVGIVIGAAFGKIVTSIVNDLLMPPIGYVLAGVNFRSLFVSLRGEYPTLEAAREAAAPVLAYGNFVQTVIEFGIVAVAVFLLVKGINRLRRTAADDKPATPPPPSEEVLLLREIRDALRDGR
jgi:large conductance mechanosensitive channel